MIGDILQPTHLLFILVIALLVLGPKRLPEVGRALGRGLRDFRNALNTDELRDQMLSTTSTQTTTPFDHQPTEQTETPVAGEQSAHEDIETSWDEPTTTQEPATAHEPPTSHEPGIADQPPHEPTPDQDPAAAHEPAMEPHTAEPATEVQPATEPAATTPAAERRP